MRPTLAALPQFLGYLGVFPPPQRVVEAIVHGPLAHLGARTGAMWQRSGDVAQLIGAFGHSAAEMSRYAVIPLAADLPIPNAMRSELPQIDSPEVVASSLGGLDHALLQPMYERLETVSSFAVPMLHAGQAVGAFGFASSMPWDPEGPGPFILEALSGALGIWITHPRSGLLDASSPMSREWSLAFTERQREVLRLVAAGEFHVMIARRLLVSEATVKADVAQAMKALRTSDRREAARRAAELGLL